MDVARYEGRAEAFLQALLEEAYQVGAGRKERLEIAPIYEAFADLFEEGVVRGLLARWEEDPSEPNRARAAFAVRGYLGAQLRELDQEIANAELTATVRWDGEELPYQALRGRIAAEPDLERRHALEALEREVCARLHPRREDRWRRLHALARSLGFAHYVDLWSRLKGVDLEGLAQSLYGFLSATARPYRRLLEARLAAARIPRQEATWADVLHLLRAPELDPLFPAERMEPALDATARGLGLDLDRFERDLEDRPRKSPRAFCAPIRIPDRVILVVRPQGGREDLHALFHEAGHAFHFSYTDPELPWTARRAGEAAVSETYAFLIEHLLEKEAWLRSVLGLGPEEAARARRHALFGRLWLLRRYAAKLFYELHLHRGPVEAAPALYRRELETALGVGMAPERALKDLDDAFYVAEYLRAWIFERQLDRWLERRHGPDWFARAGAGEDLRQLWALGEGEPVDALARRLGEPGLDLNPLTEEFLAAFAGEEVEP